MTYSLLGRDPQSGALGVAVQSKFPGVGGVTPYGAADVGVVATQGFASRRHGVDGLALLEAGASADEAIEILKRGDADVARRQFAMMAADGSAAAFTGAAFQEGPGWAGHRQRHGALALGNALAGAEVVQAMVETFHGCDADLASRLIAGLRAGRDAGGELRGQQSAALLVVKTGAGYGGEGDRMVDISIFDHGEPIEELARCVRLHRLSYLPGDPKDRMPIVGALAAELRALLQARGFSSPQSAEAGDAPWRSADVAALKTFLGYENYDARLPEDAFIDREVLEDLRRRFGRAG